MSSNFHRVPLELCRRANGVDETRLQLSDPGHAAGEERQSGQHDGGRAHPGNGGEQRPVQVLWGAPESRRCIPHQVHGVRGYGGQRRVKQDL